MQSIVFFNTKGGTGKTTICYNYGWYLADKLDKKVLLLDFDPQTNLIQAFHKGSKTKSGKNLDSLFLDYFGGKNIFFQDYTISINKNLELVPSSNNISLIDDYMTDMVIEESVSKSQKIPSIKRNSLLKEVLDSCIPADRYDYVLIDSQPNFNLLSTTAIIYAKNILVVLRPELFSLLDINYLSKVKNNLEKKFDVQINILGILVNAFEKRKKVSKEVVKILEDKYSDQFRVLENKMRYLSDYQKSITLQRKPVFRSFPSSGATKEILKVFSEIDGLIDGGIAEG